MDEAVPGQVRGVANAVGTAVGVVWTVGNWTLLQGDGEEVCVVAETEGSGVFVGGKKPVLVKENEEVELLDVALAKPGVDTWADLKPKPGELVTNMEDSVPNKPAKNKTVF